MNSLNKFFERLGVAFLVILCVFSSWIFITQGLDFGEEPGDGAKVNVYYFNNAIDTSPNELGNYWYDSGLSDQALELPDFSSAQVSVATDSTFDGDIIFSSDAFVVIESFGIDGNAVITCHSK
jgi:hypothetical protein